MRECGEDGIKIQNGRLYSYDDERWYVVENAKFCPFCGENIRKDVCMDSWNESSKNLPLVDGSYEVSNNAHIFEFAEGMAYYDGYGFLHNNVYVKPKYWRQVQTLVKRYGKVNED